MWSPTHIEVIVHCAEHLLIKGKNGTNNAFVVIELGKETYRTSIKEKSGKSVTWNEECELKIPKAGNKANLVLTAQHRNSYGLDEFLGTVRIPLASFDNLTKTIKWYKLEGKPGKEKGKDKVRGELEVEITFVSNLQTQSLTSLQSKGKSSIEQLTGSLFGLRYSDRKINVKKWANNLGKAVLKKNKKDKVNHDTVVESKNEVNVKIGNNLDPGVISDDEDTASVKSIESCANPSALNISDTSFPVLTPPPKPKRSLGNPQISISQWEEPDKDSISVSSESVTSTGLKKTAPTLEQPQIRLPDRRLSSSCMDFSKLTSPKPEKKFLSSLSLEKSPIDKHKKFSKFAKKFKNFHSSLEKKEDKRTIIGCEGVSKSDESLICSKSEFRNKDKDELIMMVVDLQKRVNRVSVRVKDLEDYLDGILLKVMNTVPKILEKS